MKRGWISGLLQGGILGAVALALLSLVMPLPDMARTLVPAVQPDVSPEPEPATERAAPAAEVPPPPFMTGAVPSRPKSHAQRPVPSLDVPAGSEFGRAGDAVPVIPAPLSAPVAREAEAPTPAPPSAEPAPRTIIAVEQPGAKPDVAPTMSAPENLMTDHVALPGSAVPPAVPAAPPPLAGSGRDSAPEISTVFRDPPINDRGLTPQQQVAPSANSADRVIPNLTLPPDLESLNAAETPE